MGKEMIPVLLSIMNILRALIGSEGRFIEDVIKRAQAGEIQILITQRSLYAAMFSVHETDKINSPRLATLLYLAKILPPDPDESGLAERAVWKPTEEEIVIWRKYALGHTVP